MGGEIKHPVGGGEGVGEGADDGGDRELKSTMRRAVPKSQWGGIEPPLHFLEMCVCLFSVCVHDCVSLSGTTHMRLNKGASICLCVCVSVYAFACVFVVHVCFFLSNYGHVYVSVPGGTCVCVCVCLNVCMLVCVTKQM